MNYNVLKEDVRLFAEQFELWEQLKSKTFLITGATGLIGSVMIKCLQELNRQKHLNIRILAVVRNLEKAEIVLGQNCEDLKLVFLNDLKEISIDSIGENVNYIIHLASPTNGKYMERYPVETFALAYQSTFKLLEMAKQKGCDSLVYASSIEYYGQILDDRLITEKEIGYVNPLSSRSSYPMGKRMAEYLCYAYAQEFCVPAKVARLTQTFGAGVSKEENRVFAQFARSVMNGNDIVLHTTGKSSKAYCYTTDTISALLYILLRGKIGDVYNVANEDTYISARDMAEYLKEKFNPAISVCVEIDESMGYAPVTRLKLSSEKLRSLGWKPRYGLYEMFDRLINYLKDE